MIIYDLTALQPHGRVMSHGGGTYAFYVLNRMLERKLRFSCIFDSSLYLDANIVKRLSENGIDMIDIKNIDIKDLSKKYQQPLFFSILPKPYMFIFPTIGTIHDCRSLELSNDWFEFLYPYRKKRIISKIFYFLFPKSYYARKLKQFRNYVGHPNFYPVTISYYTKYQMYCHLKETRFLTMPIFTTPFVVYDVNVGSNIVKENYFLLVSGDRWLKNNLRAIIALDNLFSLGLLDDFKVIVTGAESAKIYKYKIRNIDKFHFKGYVSNKDLCSLYKKAYCFIFPSLNEGFGIPPLEAMYYNTPVLASYKTAILEVCDNAAVYFDPYNVRDIMSKIIMLVSNEDIYNGLIDRGRLRVDKMMRKGAEDIDKYLDYVVSRDVNL